MMCGVDIFCAGSSFFFAANHAEVAHYRLPISEGIVNKAYATLGMQLLRHALKQQPMLYALGMGGMQNSLPQMLKAMGWGVWSVPFFYKVNHPARFLRNIRPLRKSAARRMLLDLAALSGVGWVGLKFLQRPVGEARRLRVGVFVHPLGRRRLGSGPSAVSSYCPARCGYTRFVVLRRAIADSRRIAGVGSGSRHTNARRSIFWRHAAWLHRGLHGCAR